MYGVMYAKADCADTMARVSNDLLAQGRYKYVKFYGLRIVYNVCMREFITR